MHLKSSTQCKAHARHQLSIPNTLLLGRYNHPKYTVSQASGEQIFYSQFISKKALCSRHKTFIRNA